MKAGFHPSAAGMAEKLDFEPGTPNFKLRAWLRSSSATPIASLMPNARWHHVYYARYLDFLEAARGEFFRIWCDASAMAGAGHDLSGDRMPSPLQSAGTLTTMC